MNESAGLRRFFTILFKYSRSIMLFWGIVVLTILVGNQVVDPTYEAESSIMVNFGREYLYNPEVGSQMPYNYYDRSGLINSEVEILSSRDLLEGVITSIGVDRVYPESTLANPWLKKNLFVPLAALYDKFFDRKKSTPAEDPKMAKAIDQLTRDLTILGSKESNIIRVLFQHKDPEIAANVVNLLVDLYQKKHLQMFRDQRVSNFLQEMVDQYGTELKDAERQLENYRKERIAFSVNLQEEILIRQRGDFDTALKEKESELLGLSEKLSSLRKQKENMSASTPLFSETADADRVIDNTKAELLTLHLEERELLGRLNENSPQVANVRDRIAVTEKFLKEQDEKKRGIVRVGKSLAYEEIERDISTATAEQRAQKATIDSLTKKLAEIDDSLRNYVGGEQKLNQLRRDKELKEKKYLAYVEKLEEEKISTEMDNKVLTNIKIVHLAIPPYKPLRPKKIINVLIGIALGAFGGLSISFFRDFLNQKVNIPEDLEKRLNIPVLATISQKQK